MPPLMPHSGGRGTTSTGVLYLVVVIITAGPRLIEWDYGGESLHVLWGQWDDGLQRMVRG